MRNQPGLRVAAPYYDDDVYIDEIARSVAERLEQIDFESGSDHRVLPRHAVRHAHRGRPVLRAVPKNDRSASAEATPATRSTDHDLSVPLRPSRMVEALHG